MVHINNHKYRRKEKYTHQNPLRSMPSTNRSLEAVGLGQHSQCIHCPLSCLFKKFPPEEAPASAKELRSLKKKKKSLNTHKFKDKQTASFKEPDGVVRSGMESDTGHNTGT